MKPYLSELMQCMLQPLQTACSPRAKELAVSALGAIGEERGRQRGALPGFPGELLRAAWPGPALTLLTPTATAAQSSLLPYFPTIMAHLREFLVTGHEELQPVQIQSLGEWGMSPPLGDSAG